MLRNCKRRENAKEIAKARGVSARLQQERCAADQAADDHGQSVLGAEVNSHGTGSTAAARARARVARVAVAKAAVVGATG